MVVLLLLFLLFPDVHFYSDHGLDGFRLAYVIFQLINILIVTQLISSSSLYIMSDGKLIKMNLHCEKNLV